MNSIKPYGHARHYVWVYSMLYLISASIYNLVKLLNMIEILHAVHIYEQNQTALIHEPSLEDVIHHWPAMSYIQNTARKDFLYIHFIGHNF